jgi:hypothetical protein
LNCPLLERQSGLGSIESLGLPLLVDGQHHGMLRRIDLQADDVDKLGGEFRVARALERANAMWLELVRVPNALHRSLRA